MSKRDNDDANPLLWIISLIALYISSFIMDVPNPDFRSVTCFGQIPEGSILCSQSPVSALLAALLLVLSAFILHFLNNAYSSGLNFILPLIYLILVVANPSSIYLTPMHVAAFLFVVSIAEFVKFKADTGRSADFFASVLMLFFAACFYVPLIWALPVLVFTGFPYSDDKISFLVAVLFSTICGAAFVMGATYLFSGFGEMMTLPQRCLEILISPQFRMPGYSILQLARIGIIVLLVLLAFFRNLRNRGYYKIAEAKMLRSMMVISALLLPLMLFYLPDCTAPFGAIALAPVSIVIFGLFGDSKKMLATVFSVIVMLVIVAERLVIHSDGWGIPFLQMLAD